MGIFDMFKQDNGNENKTDESKTDSEPTYEELWSKSDDELLGEKDNKTDIKDDSTKDETKPTEDSKTENNTNNSNDELINVTIAGEEKELSPEKLQELLDAGYEYKIKQETSPIDETLIDLTKGIDKDLLVAIKDAKSGNEKAKKYILDKLGIDIGSKDNDEFDFFGSEDDNNKSKDNEEDEYKPKVLDPNSIEYKVEKLKEANTEVFNATMSTFSTIPDDFKKEVSDPNIFDAFVEDVSNGIFQPVYQKAIELKAINGYDSWIEAYGKAFEVLTKGSDNINKENDEPKDTSTNKNNDSSGTNVKDTATSYEDLWNSMEV